MDIDIELSNLTRYELEEECRHLQQRCKQLRDASDEDAQKIYELKRSLETATAAEAYLSQELEQLTLNSQQQHLNTKLQNENEELRRKHHDLSLEFAALQDEYSQILSENENLRNKLDNLGAERVNNSNNDAQASSDLLTERLNVLEKENMELIQKLDEQQADRIQQTIALAERDKKIEIMKDEVCCLEENMRYKCEELEEKTRLLESAQEQLFEANSKISLLMSSPDNKDRKGNSLFAEVDDQRQAMKKLLAAQKKTFQEMKKTYDESQYEIRRLKRENRTMHTELEACSSMFYKANRTYHDQLNNRIKFLFKQNEDLEEKIKCQQQYIKDLATDKGVFWLDSMFNYCKHETEDLKKQVHSLCIKNASLEEQLRNALQDTVRWRFEALKSRCILLDREYLLENHQIAFKPQNAVEFNITEAEEKAARPRIVPIEDFSNNNKKVENYANDNQTESQVKHQPKDSLISTSLNAECNKENDTANIFPESKAKTNLPSTLVSDNQTRKILQEISPHINVELENTTLPSILIKQRDVLPSSTEKKVKFATNKTTVYNSSASGDSVIEAEAENVENSNGKNTSNHDSQVETNVKTVRTKSVVVRRFVIKSKNK